MNLKESVSPWVLNFWGHWSFESSGDVTPPMLIYWALGIYKWLVLMFSPNKTFRQNASLFRIFLILTYGQFVCFLAVSTDSSPGSSMNFHVRHPVFFSIYETLFVESLPLLGVWGFSHTLAKLRRANCVPLLNKPLVSPTPLNGTSFPEVIVKENQHRASFSHKHAPPHKRGWFCVFVSAAVG